MATTTVYPNGDGTNGGWLNEVSSSSNLYLSVDEGTDSPNDADYSIADSNVTMAYLLGNMPSDLDTVTACTVKVRLQRQTFKGADRQFSTCAIYQSDESTALTATCDLTSTTSTITTYTFNPSVTGATDKTSWDGARLKFNTPTGSSGGILIYAAQVEITYSTAAAGQPTGARKMLVKNFQFFEVGRSGGAIG